MESIYFKFNLQWPDWGFEGWAIAWFFMIQKSNYKLLRIYTYFDFYSNISRFNKIIINIFINNWYKKNSINIERNSLYLINWTKSLSIKIKSYDYVLLLELEIDNYKLIKDQPEKNRSKGENRTSISLIELSFIRWLLSICNISKVIVEAVDVDNVKWRQNLI